jgi:hypothetical protein
MSAPTTPRNRPNQGQGRRINSERQTHWPDVLFPRDQRVTGHRRLVPRKPRKPRGYGSCRALSFAISETAASSRGRPTHRCWFGGSPRWRPFVRWRARAPRVITRRTPARPESTRAAMLPAVASIRSVEPYLRRLSCVIVIPGDVAIKLSSRELMAKRAYPA